MAITDCRNCGNGVEPGDQFCANCGSKVANMDCRECGTELRDGVRFCTVCGTPTEVADPPEAGAQTTAEPQSTESEPSAISLPCPNCGHPDVDLDEGPCELCGHSIESVADPAEDAPIPPVAVSASPPSSDSPTGTFMKLKPPSKPAEAVARRPTLADYSSMPRSEPPPADTNASSPFSVGAMICGGLAFFFLPPFLGSAGIILAVVGMVRGEKLGPVGLAVSILGLLVGMFIGALVGMSV